MGEEKQVIRRDQVRISVRDKVDAAITICNVFGQHVEAGTTPVLLEDISLSGMKFQTFLKFPVNKNYTLRVRVTLGEWDFSLLAHVLWRRKEENLYVYGCSFLPDNKLRRALAAALQDKLRLMNPTYYRIHQLYQRMVGEAMSPVSYRMDKRC